jgi:capsular polysaccharide biosynthesis protein
MFVAGDWVGRLNRWRAAGLFRAPLKALSSLEYADRSGADWRETYAPTPVQRLPPTAIGPSSGELESKLCAQFPSVGVLIIPAGSLFGPEGWVVGTDGHWLPEHSWFRGHASEARPLISRRQLRKFSGTGLTLASNWSSGNYGHLLLDSLSRLHLFAAAGFSFADVDYIYCPAGNPDKAAALLRRYGVPVDKCMLAPLPAGSGIQFDSLIAPTFPGIRRNYPPWVPAFLRSALPRVTREPYRYLYITRGKGTRKLANESKLIPHLVQAGFEIYDPSQHPDPWLDFSAAAAVIGAHGAGLADLAFCAAGTAVLELLPSDHVHPYYCSLSQAAGLHYGYLIGPSEGHRSAGAWGPSPYDFTVEEALLLRGLDWIRSLSCPGAGST